MYAKTGSTHTAFSFHLNFLQVLSKKSFSFLYLSSNVVPPLDRLEFSLDNSLSPILCTIEMTYAKYYKTWRWQLPRSLCTSTIRHQVFVLIVFTLTSGDITWWVPCPSIVPANHATLRITCSLLLLPRFAIIPPVLPISALPTLSPHRLRPHSCLV